jgi:D-serine deaminase-like pyridoxal phosphate-dependent protein
MRHGMGMNNTDSNSSAAQSVARKSLDDAILEVLARPDVKTLSAPEIANAIATDGDWHDLLVPIRSTAVALAQAGRLVIYRKGKPVDPTDFRGVYRLGLPRHD